MEENRYTLLAEGRAMGNDWKTTSVSNMGGVVNSKTYKDKLGIYITVFRTGDFTLYYKVPNSTTKLKSGVCRKFDDKKHFTRIYNNIKGIVTLILFNIDVGTEVEVGVKASCLEEATEPVRMNHIIYIVNVIFKTTDFCNERGHNPFKDIDLKELNTKSTDYILALSKLAEEVYESYLMGESYRAILNDIDTLSEKEFNQKYEIRSRKNS